MRVTGENKIEKEEGRKEKNKRKDKLTHNKKEKKQNTVE